MHQKTSRLSTIQKFICLIFPLFLFSCNTPVNVIKEVNYSSLYNPIATKIHPVYTVFHDSDQSSTLFIKLYPKEFLYNQANQIGTYLSKVKIQFSLTDITNIDESVVVDTGMIEKTFEREGVEARVILSLPVETNINRLYVLKVSTTDLVRKDQNVKFIYLDRTSEFTQHNFLILDQKDLPVFSPYIINTNPFRIKSNSLKDHDSIFLLYYNKEMRLPKPTYGVINEDSFFSSPDSIWKLPYSENISYSLQYKGIYLFKTDTTINMGLPVFNFGENFPEVKEPIELVEPLVYLTNSAEYANLKTSVNLKFAVDNFWLGCNNKTEAARELIRVYYNRVHFANYYFTSFRPGWQTDRGMVYLIYGPPHAIYVSTGNEKWIYFKKNFSSSMTFIFNYKASSFTQENFILERSEDSNWQWREAITFWRNGKVYLYD